MPKPQQFWAVFSKDGEPWIEVREVKASKK